MQVKTNRLPARPPSLLCKWKNNILFSRKFKLLFRCLEPVVAWVHLLYLWFSGCLPTLTFDLWTLKRPFSLHNRCWLTRYFLFFAPVVESSVCARVKIWVNGQQFLRHSDLLNFGGVKEFQSGHFKLFGKQTWNLTKTVSCKLSFLGGQKTKSTESTRLNIFPGTRALFPERSEGSGGCRLMSIVTVL